MRNLRSRRRSGYAHVTDDMTHSVTDVDIGVTGNVTESCDCDVTKPVTTSLCSVSSSVLKLKNSRLLQGGGTAARGLP